MSREIEGRSFTTSVLYWIGVLEQQANGQFARALNAPKSVVARWRTLSILAEKSGLPISELARHTFIERTAISHLLRQMAKEGLIERRSRRGDKRTIEIHITAAGRRSFNRMLPMRRAIFKAAARDLDRQDIATLMRVIRHLADNLDNIASSNAPAKPRRIRRKPRPTSAVKP
jgi:DNA-binding MarR family transcriptional regulator